MEHPSRRDSSDSTEPNRSTVSVARRRFLRASVGVAVTGLGTAALSGNAAAHFPLGLDIDVRPGSGEKPINPDARGLIPVAVLQTDDFDPTSEGVRYRFGAPDVVSAGGGARPAHGGHVEDVDGDGRDDLVLHFRTAESGFDGDESEARLEWERDETGAHGLSGTDVVTIVGGTGQ